MSRWKWTPIRHVAENVSAGDRSYWNLMKIPELSCSKVSEAISEMERIGVLSVTGYRVEPTAAFGLWLAELRRREDQPQAVPPPNTPTSDGSPERADKVKSPAPKPTRLRKRYFRRLSSDRHEAGLEMAARIRDLLDRRSGSCRSRCCSRLLVV